MAKVKDQRPKLPPGYTYFSEVADKIMSPERRARVLSKADQVVLNIRLAELRKALKVKQTELKGFTQPGISKIESGEDMRVSTLIEYLHALGASVEITAVIEEKQHKTKKISLLKTGT